MAATEHYCQDIARKRPAGPEPQPQLRKAVQRISGHIQSWYIEYRASRHALSVVKTEP